jgi:hypothetical protein
MKQHMVKLSVIAFTIVATTLGSAAVGRAEDTVVAKVPFAFIAGDVQMPSGVYIVREMTDSSGVIGIKKKDGHEFVYALTIPSSVDTPVGKPELIFEKFGDHYFLARIVPQGGNEREIVLTPSTMERDIIRTSSQTN